jgi:hypothetical protein
MIHSICLFISNHNVIILSWCNPAVTRVRVSWYESIYAIRRSEMEIQEIV